MSDVGARLKALREARGLEARVVAEALGIPRSTFTQYENGRREPGKKRVKQITDFYRASAEHVIYGTKPPAPTPPKPEKKTRPVRVIPVISWVAAGQVREHGDLVEPTKTIEISGLPSGDYFATRVQGDSMDRLSPDGSLIVVNMAETELRRGRRYIFNLRGQTTYKRWEPDPDRLVPESTNPANEPIFPKASHEWSVIGRVRLTLLDNL